MVPDQVASDCIQEVIESGEVGHYEIEHCVGDGRVQYFDVRVAPVFDEGEVVALLSSSIDISRRKRAEDERLNLERQVQHAQKLESLGVLAGGGLQQFRAAVAGHDSPESDSLDGTQQLGGRIDECRSPRRGTRAAVGRIDAAS